AAWPATRRLEARSSHAVVGVVGREGAGVALCDRERRATPTADCGPAAALSCAPLAARASTKSLGHHGDGVSSPAGPPEAGPPPAYCAAAADPPHCHIQGITRSRSAPGRNPLTGRRSGIDCARAESQGCTTTTFKQNTESGLLPTAS
ncbi:unnamed protein product, partial [Tenebrio molitor]